MSNPRIFPVFPLPNTVFFPHTSLPLHVFEPRYRSLVLDAMAGEGLFVVSLASGRGLSDVATLGRVRDLESLEEGRFKLRLEGLERVSLSEVPSGAPYRQVQVTARPERAGTDDTSVIDDARLELLASYSILRRLLVGHEPFLLPQGIPFEVVVNSACASLPIDAAARQRLLAKDSLIGRQRLGLEYLTTVIETLTWLRASKNEGAGSLLN